MSSAQRLEDCSRNTLSVAKECSAQAWSSPCIVTARESGCTRLGISLRILAPGFSLYALCHPDHRTKFQTRSGACKTNLFIQPALFGNTRKTKLKHFRQRVVNYRCFDVIEPVPQYCVPTFVGQRSDKQRTHQGKRFARPAATVQHAVSRFAAKQLRGFCLAWRELKGGRYHLD